MNQKPFILDCSTAMSWCFKDEGLPMTTNDKTLMKACHHNGIPLLDISSKNC